MSPSPNALGIPRAGDGWLMIGIIVRVIRFRSLFKVIGVTAECSVPLKNRGNRYQMEGVSALW